MRPRMFRKPAVLTALLAAIVLTLGVVSSGFAANPSADLDQCANDPAPSPNTNGCSSNANQWVNGNLGGSKANYFEGDSIPYRLRFDNLSLSSHTVTIEWDTTKSSKHALDYLTTYNYSVADANPCLGVTGCSSSTTFPIPADPQVTGAGVTQASGVFTFYGGTITAVSAYSYANGTGFTGDKSARITITFTPTRANPVLAWGGHISTRKDWGALNSAVTIPGSPYHTRLIDLDGAGGNQDRSLSNDAVIFPGSITIIKDATPNGSTSFSFTASPAPLANFSLVDDGTSANTKVFSNITTFQTYTVAESTPPTNWNFTGVTCSVTSPNGGSSSTNGATATINMKEGENYTCTYTNSENARPSITTTLSASSVTVGSQVHDSSTLTNATSNAGGTVTYNVYSDNTCSTLVTSAGTKTVTNGVVPDSDAVTFNSAGTFYWQASYSGDTFNQAATSTCTDETLVVNKTSAGISTAQNLLPNDSATVSGATTNAGGTITFNLFAPSDATCSATPAYTQTVNVSGNGTYATSNTTFKATDEGTWRWLVAYSGDANNQGATSQCGTERFTIANQ